MNLEKMGIENYQESSVDERRIDKIAQLNNPKTPLGECIEIAQDLFPYERKREMLDKTDRDRRGRPVSYFRLMSYAELESSFLRGKTGPLDHPRAREAFNSRTGEIKNAIQNAFNDLPDEVKKEISPDFNKLMGQFTFESAASFLQNKLPLGSLLSFHFAKGEIFPGIDGLISCSAGIPVMPPSESFQKEDETILVEMAIPSDDVIVGPVLHPIREMAKEVDTRNLKPEWIVDIYQGNDDFLKRFVLNPDYPMAAYYEDYLKTKGKSKEYAGPGDVFNVLQEWKQNEPLQDLIPVEKIANMDTENPILKNPLYPSK